MQNHQTQAATPIKLTDHVGFVYNNFNRTFSCLGQEFTDVAFYEINDCREIAIKNYNNRLARSEPKTRYSGLKKQSTHVELKLNEIKEKPKKLAPKKPHDTKRVNASKNTDANASKHTDVNASKRRKRKPKSRGKTA